VLVPPNALRDHNAGLDGFADDSLGLEAAAVVLNSDELAITDAAAGGVGGMYLDCGVARRPAQAGNVGERGVEGRRDGRAYHLQGEAGGKFGPGLRVFMRRCVRRQRIDAALSKRRTE